MKKSNLLKATLATAMAIGAGIASSPSGQQVVEQVAQSAQTTVQTQQQQRVNNNQQQTQQASHKTARSASTMNPYAMPGGDRHACSTPGLSPKDYGLYLLRSGKYRQNTLKRKHYAKAFS